MQKKLLNSAIIKENMQKMMGEENRYPVREIKGYILRYNWYELFPLWVVFPFGECCSSGWEATFSPLMLLPGIIR